MWITPEMLEWLIVLLFVSLLAIVSMNGQILVQP